MDNQIKDNHTGIWKVAPGEQAYLWQMCLQQECIVIGWLDDVDYRTFPDKNTLRQALGEEKGGASHIWYFVHTIQLGDIVIANKGRMPCLTLRYDGGLPLLS